MCERCLIINGLADEISALVPVLKSDRTEDAWETAFNVCPGLAQGGLTVEQFQELPIFEICGLVAIRLARAVSAVDEVPCSSVLGQWASMSLDSEMLSVAESPLGQFLKQIFGIDAVILPTEDGDEEEL